MGRGGASFTRNLLLFESKSNEFFVFIHTTISPECYIRCFFIKICAMLTCTVLIRVVCYFLQRKTAEENKW
jgi:hypothetical protein